MLLKFRTQTLEHEISRAQYKIQREMIEQFREYSKEQREQIQSLRLKVLELATFDDIKKLREKADQK